MNHTLIGGFLIAYLIAFLLVTLVWRSWLAWRRTGINPVRLGTSQSTHDFIGRLFAVVTLGIVTSVTLYTFRPGAYDWITVRGINQGSIGVLAGVPILILAFFWVALAQLQMGNSWRIGIDREHGTELVTSGLFRVSRNPIFLGMRVALLGIALILPDLLTLVALVLGDTLIQIQVRLEEEHLRQIHGATYEQYFSTTRRWL